ncbi:thioredoxin-dependent thiol peroxidase [Rufibacter latericius]|uniref:thioredoxin-dependent peroxiredoxin n=1 Tax=Rufibacter latericius TaxID=2487040 RepID=A0A3M9MU58_9BACT|nr:thioredoxin-dependent thiol peroxidase [Rufibacter latericius]RNI29060.1 thioredoxin-dependent thiol peroxidase [Rufibacter latericius]
MLQIGDAAPDFEVKDQNGLPVKMGDFRGKKVVLYFYPKDDTPGCTAQACNLRDNYDALLAKGFVVLGVSVDDEKSHQKFIQKFDLPFPLLADTEHEIVEKYGVWQEKNMYGRKYMGTMRYTFVIDEEGTIEDIITKVDTKNHTAQLLK